jgi:hypothetical protein
MTVTLTLYFEGLAAHGRLRGRQGIAFKGLGEQG